MVRRQTEAARTEDNPLLAAALDYAARGRPVFPCKRADKSPLTQHGFHDASTDPEVIRAWWRQYPRAMVGMPTGPASGIDVLDLDLKPEEYIDGFGQVPNWQQLSRVIVRTPSGGAHLWFKSEGNIRNSSDTIAPGVDTRGDGGYVIVPPSQSQNGSYTFSSGGLEDHADLPPFPSELLERLGRRSEPSPSASPDADPERIRAAMRTISNADVGWDDWKRFGLAIWRATSGGEQGFAIWDEWSRKSSKYDADNTRREWEAITRSPPTRIGAGTIFYHANQADPRQRQSVPGTVVLARGVPVPSAFAFIRHGYQAEGMPGLAYYRGNFYEWTGTHYSECDDDHLRSKLYEFLNNAVTPDGEPFNPTAHQVNQVIDALEAVVEQHSRLNTPFWLNQEPHPDPALLIACKNGLLNIETRELLPHTPLLFNLNSLPYDYDPNAPTYPKLWMKFLRQLWPDDADDKLARFALQEMFGLMLTPDTRYQKIFMNVGPKRSGKGTIGRVLTALVGKDNVANPTMASMTGEFGLWPLIDKQLAIISDARLGKQTDANVVAERLLSISGEDGQTINRKNKAFWFGRLYVRFVILTNELPRIADASGALASRFVVLTLKKSFYGKEDLELTDKLLAELPGILNWALKGLHRLRQRGRFRMPKASLEAIRQLEDLASPVTAFLRDWCRLDPQARQNVKELFAAWRCWCEEHGFPAGSSIVFGRNLRAARPEIGTTGRGIDRSYTGIELSQDRYDQYRHAVAARRSGRQARGEED
jgi:putative DNA primase/helicase